jgi:hypothetical protein
VELLDGIAPPRPETTARGAEVPSALVGAAAPDQLKREAERLEASAELAALRRAVAAEQLRLETLGQQRATAEAALAGLQQQARPNPPEPPAPEPATAGVTEPQVTPLLLPPGAARPVPRSRNEARPEERGEGRVHLYYLAGSPAARQAAEDAAAVLRDAGVEAVDLRPIAEVPENRLVRYHRAGDAGLAARLAGRLGRGWALQDSRGFDPGGPARGLEIWLPDR